MAGALIGLLLAGPVAAYRFWSEVWGDDGFPIAPTTDEAQRWDADTWGPGETLRWEVSPDEDWDVLFESAKGALPYVERAMASWSGIATADISWTLDGVGDAEPGFTEDSTNALFIDADAGFGGRAGHWETRESDGGLWRFFGCDVALGGSFTWKPDDFDGWTPEQQSNYLDWRRERAVYVLVHEFGHCIGLAHSARLSTALWDLAGNTRTHPGDPSMSYGRALPHADDLSRDDIVGASLLRPAPGHRQRSGNIAGAVTMPGLPVDFASVWALPVGQHPLRDRVGVFTNRTGEFEIEGLDPGEYLLIAQPIIDFDGPHPFLSPGQVNDVMRGRLVRVVAGRTVRGVDVTMRWGRDVRAPYAEVDSRTGQEGSIPITSAWGIACSSIRVRAERPRADGGFDDWLDGEWSKTTLTLEYPASADVLFDWVGPYRDWEYLPVFEEVEEDEREQTGWRFLQWPFLTPYLDIGHEDWRISRSGSTVRHEMELSWPPDAEPTLRIRSDDHTCDSEALVVCGSAGCELRQSVASVGGETSNRAPVAVGRIPDQTLTQDGSGKSVNVSGYFNDPDGDHLSYHAASSDTSIVGVITSGSGVWLGPLGVGTATVTVTATDPGVLQATQRFMVTVSPGNQCSIEDLGTLTPRTTPLTRSGSLGNDCSSPNDSRKLARFYSFRLSESSRVQIDLESNAFDPLLILRTGSNISGRQIERDDDDGSGTDSRIVRELPAGTYTIEATSYLQNWTGSFTVRIARTEGSDPPTGNPIEAVGEIECSISAGPSGSGLANASISGRLRALRDVTDVVVTGNFIESNGDRETHALSPDRLGSMDAGETKPFSLSGSFTTTATRFSCEARVEWRESLQTATISVNVATPRSVVLSPRN